MKDKTGIILVISAGICWGLISIFVNGLGAFGLDSLQIMAVRTWLSVIFMLIFFLVKDRSLLKINIKDIWMFIGTGVVSLTFFSFCYFRTIIESGAAIAVVLLYTSPIFVMLLSLLLFKEKINLKKSVALVMTFLGCVLVAGLVGSGSHISAPSFLVGLGAGIGYALYSIFARFALNKYSSLTVTFYTFVFSGLSMLFLVNINDLQGIATINAVPYLIGIAIICTVIPYITYTAGLARMEAGRAAVLVTVEPLVGTTIGILVYKEPMDILKLLGIVLIFVAVILLSLPDKKAMS